MKIENRKFILVLKRINVVVAAVNVVIGVVGAIGAGGEAEDAVFACRGKEGPRPGGNRVARRGKAKYLGGNGRKTTGITRRQFKHNLQRVRVLEDGKIVRRNVPVSLLRTGVIEKPVVRKPFTIDEDGK